MGRGYREIRLYPHQTMTENQRLHAAVGYEVTGRGTGAGYDRVFRRKRLGDSASETLVAGVEMRRER